MGRTAPAPDVPAPPGMAPGTAVKGGGGSGGGGGGRGAGSGGGGSGGGPGGAGSGAGGGDKGAGTGDPDGKKYGGSGGKGGCPNPSHGAGGAKAAGDPFDVVTGRVFTAPTIDLKLGGPMPLVIERAYSSAAATRDVGLGPGWSHSLAIEIELRLSGAVMWHEDGQVGHLGRMDVGGELPIGSALLQRNDEDFVLRRDRAQLHFRELVVGSGRHLLVLVRDNYGNDTQLEYDDAGNLTGATDCVGRRVRVARNERGQIEAFEALNAPAQGRWVRFVQYQYDENGNLVATTDACGGITRYRYQGHLLAKQVTPSGCATHYLYDRRRRCIETWVDYDGRPDESLDSSVGAWLADGATPARGVLHVRVHHYDDFIEVVTSSEARQVHPTDTERAELSTFGGGVSTAEYDERERMTAFTDACGATTRWAYADEGGLLEHTDALGHGTQYDYDPRGRLVGETDASGRTLRFERNHAGDVIAVDDDSGRLVEHAFDARGLWTFSRTPDGGETHMSYDHMGNRVNVIEPNGAESTFRYDYFGQLIGSTDEHGRERIFAYDACGRLLSVRDPDGALRRYEYDGDGHLVASTSPGGHRFELSWSGYHDVHEVRRPDGTTARYRYDREGHLVRVINELGEENVYQRDAAGRVVAESTFDGRHIAYQLDPMGRVARVTYSSGEFIDVQFDAVGRVATRSWNDEIVETFEYDALDRLIRASDGTVDTEFAYDAAGHLVRETTMFGGEDHVVESDYDSMGLRIAKRTSRGHAERMSYDAMGAASMVAFDRGFVDFRRDIGGAEVARRLAGGAEVRSVYGSDERRSRRQLVPSGSSAPSFEQSYRYEPRGFLTSLVTNGARQSSLYDPVGRVLKKGRESFVYDGADNLQSGGAIRRYEVGGRLVSNGSNTYHYDADGRLVERQAGDQKWTYEWSSRGRLSCVRCPDGSRVEMLYDAFARRVQKRVFDRDGELTKRTRYVWDQEAIVHEIQTVANAAGDPVVQERTFVYDPNEPLTPLAHRMSYRSLADQEPTEEEPWIYYLTEPTSRPELLVSGTGDVLASYTLETWGHSAADAEAHADTPLRFAGHWADEETGLFYNRYRHYDPESGRYISPEPRGLASGMRPYGYVRGNPVHFVDPDGLDMVATAHDGNGTKGVGKSGPKDREGLHPIVQDELLHQDDSLHNVPCSTNKRKPEGCAEPEAISKYLHEKNIPNKKFEDMSPDEQRRTKAALQEMKIGAKQTNGDKRARAPCMNCSQLLANLNNKYGGPKSANIDEGYKSARSDKEGKPLGEPTNFSSPTEGKSKKSGGGYHAGYKH